MSHGLAVGLLLLVSKNDRRLRFETGYGLHGIFPDVLAGRVIRDVGRQLGTLEGAAREQVRVWLERAERIRSQLGNSPMHADLPQLRIAASFGVAGLAPGDADFGALCARADRALYAAKEAGRDRVCLLQPDASGR